VRKASYHNHTDASDGRSALSEMVARAIECGFSDFAITDHVYDSLEPSASLNPKDYQSYIAAVNSAKQATAGEIAIYTGLEAEWFYGNATGDTELEGVRDDLDILVGSVHYLICGEGRILVDGSAEQLKAGLAKGFGGDVRAMVENYFASYIEMATTLKPDLCAHPDIIRKNGAGLFTGEEAWYVDCLDKAARAMKAAGSVTEVNGGGNYRYHNGVVYPSRTFIEILRSFSVPFTVGLDAHSTDMVDSYYADSIAYLKEAGVKSLMAYDGKHGWVEEGIDSWAKA